MRVIWGIVAAMLCALALAACGGSSSSSVEEGIEQAPAAEHNGFSDDREALTSHVQEEARELCSVFPQAQMAKEYGVANDPAAVAHAAASEYRSGLQADAEAGCLEGLGG